MRKLYKLSWWIRMETLICTFTIILNLSLASFASAQEDGQEAVRKEEIQKEYQLDKITVTAPGKRVEDIQKVPASVSYFSDIDLENAGIENTYDLIQLSPNLHMKHNKVENLVVIRGISLFSASLHSPSGFYVDDVCYPIQYMHNPDFFDLDSVEILRGPQGTLYGRNTESGLISVTTKKPGNEFQGKIFGEYGNYSSYKLGASIGGPIVKDKFYMGVSGLLSSSDGYVKNINGDDDEAAQEDHKNGRITLRYTPTERWDISLIGDFMDTDDGYAEWRFIDGPTKTNPHEVNQDQDQYSRQNGNDQILRVKYEGESLNVISVSSLINYEQECFVDMDFGADSQDSTISDASYEDEQFSQEIRISSAKSPGPFKWVVGIYGFKEETDTDYEYFIVNKPTWGLADMSYMNPKANIKTRGYAGFGEGTYTVFDKFHITAGLRYDYQSLEGKITGKYFDFYTFSHKDYDCSKDLDYREWLPKFSVSYDLSDDVMAYVLASKGYNVGGYIYSPTSNIAEDAFSYDSEYTWNYEAGIKTSWFNNKISANLTLFYIDIKDKQVADMDQITWETIVTNAAGAHSQGVELELAAHPAKGLDVFAGFGYTESKYDDFIITELNDTSTALVQSNYNDNYLQYAPKYTYSIGAQYRHESGLFSRVDIIGSSEFYGDYENKAKADGYTTVNLRLGYEMEHLDFVVWAKNIFDEEYLSYANYVYDNVVGVDAPPRTIGATITYRF